jgi:hypothetical protein
MLGKVYILFCQKKADFTETIVSRKQFADYLVMIVVSGKVIRKHKFQKSTAGKTIVAFQYNT